MDNTLKINPNIFQDDKIRLLTLSADGYRNFYIWLKLLCKLKMDGSKDGKILLNKKPTTASRLAIVLDEMPDILESAFDAFEEFNLIENIDDTWVIPNWQKYQNPKKKVSEVSVSRFTPPTVDEVRAYCFESKVNVDAEQFVSFYESKGWYIGKNKMVSWKKAVQTWAKSDRRKSEEKKNREQAKANGSRFAYIAQFGAEEG